MIEYIHVGSDSQKMNFQQKWINFFIRYTIEGLPVTTTLGVQRVFGHSTGANLRQLFEDLVTGQHLQSEIQTGKTLHEGLSSDSDDESTPSHPKHIFDRLRSNGVKCGMDWDVFLEKLASISTDGGSDFAGKHQGFTGLLRSEVTTHTLNSYWCCAHVWDLISTDLSNNPDVDVFRLSDSFFSDLGKRCRASTLFKDALEKELISAGIKPFSFCLKLDGRWEMSEYSILLKIIASLKVLVRIRDPDADNPSPSQRLYSGIREIASVFVCCAIREINVKCLMEPSEQHEYTLFYSIGWSRIPLLNTLLLSGGQFRKSSQASSISSSFEKNSCMIAREDFFVDNLKNRFTGSSIWDNMYLSRIQRLHLPMPSPTKLSCGSLFSTN